MEELLKPIYEEQIKRINTLGVIIIEKAKPTSPITDNFDVILLQVVNGAEQAWDIKHYEVASGKVVAIHTITADFLEDQSRTNESKLFEWIVNGKVIFERDEYVTKLKKQYKDFPEQTRDLKKAMEFGKLIKSFYEAKDLYESAQYKDAYSSIVHSLHYLARLAVIKQGDHPSLTVWSQVKHKDLEVYKLYEELIYSNENIEKRIQLMLIAADFVIRTRAELSASHLLNVMKTKDAAWTYAELLFTPSLEPYAPDLTAMIFYLTEKGIIESKLERTCDQDVYIRRYQVK